MITVIKADHKVTSLRFDSDHLFEMDKLATQLGVSRSNLVRVAINYFLENKTTAISNLAPSNGKS